MRRVYQNYSISRPRGRSPGCQGLTEDLFLRRGVDAIPIMYYDQYDVLSCERFDLEELTLAPCGITDSTPRRRAYCLAPTYKASPDLCRTVAKASIEG